MGNSDIGTGVARWAGVVAIVAGCGGSPKPIAEALDHCDSRLPRKPVEGRGDMKKVTVERSEGRCNDGSPPVMYIRPATDPAHADDWVVWFEGGGQCNDYTSCMTRWCNLGPYDANLMSSEFRGPTMKGEGVLDPTDRNAFAGWNAVGFRYCTSDVWMGTEKKPVAFSGMFSTITLPFEGDLVVDAFLEELTRGVRSDDRSMTLPPLGNARRIVVSGESAGGMGALQHVDEFAERFPQAEVIGVIDGYNSPEPRVLSKELGSTISDIEETAWDNGFRGVWKAKADDDCTSDDRRCMSGSWLIENAVSSPLVVRMDLRDPVISDLYTQNGVTMDQYAGAMKATLEALAEDRTDSTFLGTRCSRHIVVTNEDYYAMESAEGGQGTGYTLQDAVEAFVLRDRRVVAIENPNGSTDCGDDVARQKRGRERQRPDLERERRRENLRERLKERRKERRDR